MVVDTDATSYEQTFDDMFAYAFDWMEGRAAWLSEKFAPDYTPSVLIGDADRDGSVTILDATRIQRFIAELEPEENIDMIAADADRDGSVTVVDATRIQRVLAELCDMDGNMIPGKELDIV